jgi:hypothetical protein
MTNKKFRKNNASDPNGRRLDHVTEPGARCTLPDGYTSRSSAGGSTLSRRLAADLLPATDGSTSSRRLAAGMRKGAPGAWRRRRRIRRRRARLGGRTKPRRAEAAPVRLYHAWEWAWEKEGVAGLCNFCQGLPKNFAKIFTFPVTSNL